jgi:hypothetical protein
MLGANLLQHVPPAQAGHHDIEQHEVEVAARDELESAAAVRGGDHRVSAARQAP